MDGWTELYLRLTSVAAVSAFLLDPRPAFVFAADGARVLWANAAGAEFLGADSVAEALSLRFSQLNPIREQAARLTRTVPAEHPRMEVLRFGRGVSISTLPALCQRLNRGNERLLLAIGVVSANAASLAARAEMLVGALGRDGTLAAVVTDEGRVLAASPELDALAAEGPALDDLIADGLSAKDGRVEGLVGSARREAGAVRFAADGRSLLLLIVGQAQSREAGTTAKAAAASPPPVPAPTPDPPPLAKAPEPPAATVPPPAMATAPVATFTWEADADGRLTLVSPELAEAAGESNAAIVGHTWTAIAEALGFDDPTAAEPGAAVTVYWPAADAGDRIAVDLTIFAAHGRFGSVSGYRGFGQIRGDDRQPDERDDKSDLIATGRVAAEPEATEEAAAVTSSVETEPTGGHKDLDDAARKSVEEGSSTAADDAPSSNVVRLPQSQQRPPLERLTGTERDAFRRIAEALGLPPESVPDIELKSPPSPEPARAEVPSEVDTRLLDRLPIGVAIFRDRRTLFANRTLLELLGYGSLDAFLQAGGAEAIFPGDRGLAGNIAEAGGKLTARHSDGGELPVRAWLHAVTFAGATALMLSIDRGSSSIADEDAAAVALARSDARTEELEAILNTATDGVIVIDGRGKIDSMNKAAEALFGVNGSEYAGRYFTDLLADESQKQALDYLDGLAANGVASVLNDGREVIGRVPQGGLIPLFMTMGRIAGTDKFCAVLRDLTHWKNVEGELVAARRSAEEANQQKSDFLAKISHEIRTPLNAIIGFSEVMMEERFGTIDNPRYRDYLRDIHVSGAHLMSLINDLLDLSKIEAGKVDLSFESVPVNAIIQECVGLMQPQANRERIIIRTSLASDLPNVVADPRSFRQILLNLLSNAIKFTRAGGQVIVSSALEATGEIVVRIRDTGIGMSPKDLETAMKPFRQVALSRDDREHGTGLGLPLTKALVEANRATFAIESAPNQGTLVKITFPTTRVLAG